MTRLLPPLLAALLVAACTPIPKPAAPPPAAPPSLPAPAAAATTEWRDMPLTAGEWRYTTGADGSTASFGAAGTTPLFALRCDRARRTVVLARPGTAAGTISVQTSYGAQSWPGQATGDGMVAATLAAADPALDRIAFSRGRFSVALPGATLLMLPARAEPGRVVEDCRS